MSLRLRAFKKRSMTLWRNFKGKLSSRKPAFASGYMACQGETPRRCNDTLSEMSHTHYSHSEHRLTFNISSPPYLHDLPSPPSGEPLAHVPCKNVATPSIHETFAHPYSLSTSTTFDSGSSSSDNVPELVSSRKRSRPRPLSRSLVVAWKHVSANLRSQDPSFDESEFVTSNFILVGSTSFTMSTHSLSIPSAIAHPDTSIIPDGQALPRRPRSPSYDYSESFLELSG